MTAQPYRDWFGIRADDPPEKRHDFADLQRMAESMLATRRKRFPDMIAAGEILAEDAQAELAACEDLVADWRFVASGGADGEPGSSLTIAHRRRILDSGLQTIADIACQQGGFSETLGRQAECVIALRWHLEPGRDQIALARLTHQLRADAAAAQGKEPVQ